MHYQEILLLPFLLVAVFAVVSIAIIAYRVYSFNDCHQEAKELQEQILQAKADLAKRGIKFDWFVLTYIETLDLDGCYTMKYLVVIPLSVQVGYQRWSYIFGWMRIWTFVKKNSEMLMSTVGS